MLKEYVWIFIRTHLARQDYVLVEKPTRLDITIQVRQQTQQYLEIVILVNVYGYTFRLILS
jgi:hypothetical protein